MLHLLATYLEKCSCTEKLIVATRGDNVSLREVATALQQVCTENESIIFTAESKEWSFLARQTSRSKSMSLKAGRKRSIICRYILRSTLVVAGRGRVFPRSDHYSKISKGMASEERKNVVHTLLIAIKEIPKQRTGQYF